MSEWSFGYPGSFTPHLTPMQFTEGAEPSPKGSQSGQGIGLRDLGSDLGALCEKRFSSETCDCCQRARRADRNGAERHLRLLLRVLRTIGVAGGGTAGERPVGIVRASGLHEGLGAGNDVGLGPGEVFRFREVGREIVEFER